MENAERLNSKSKIVSIILLLLEKGDKMRMKEKTTAVLLIAMFMITTLVMVMPVSAKLEEYSYLEYIDVECSDYDLKVNVTEDGEWVTWEFDFPVEYFIGGGNLNVGLIIATGDEGEGPTFQIHNNDGTDSSFPWGTWLVSPWGPTIDDGWFGWHSGDTNTEVSALSWVEASGNKNVPHGDGILTISIHESKLGHRFFWAASPTVGSGFWDAYDVTMQIPTDFNWGTPLVDMDVPNYEFAQIVIPRPPPRLHGGPIYFDGVSSGLLFKTPHKLIVVDLRNAPHDEGHYLVVINILAGDGTLAYTRTFFVRPFARSLALYLHESEFPDGYTVSAYCPTGPLPYIVASREGIERSG